MTTKLNDWLKMIAMVLLIVGLGIFAVNQTLSYYYKAEFLKDPCGLCSSLEGNEHLLECFEEASTVITYKETEEEAEPFQYDLKDYVSNSSS